MYYIYSKGRAFKTLARVIRYHLKEPSEIVDNTSKTDGVYIFDYSAYREGVTAEKYIVVQLEPLEENKFKSDIGYLQFIEKAIDIWDYTKTFKLGYSPIFEIEKEESKPIDILFYGTPNDKRLYFLNRLQKEIPDADVRIEYGVWGKDLDNLINNSKIVLSLFYYDNDDIDLRLPVLISKRAFVIAEQHTRDVADYLRECCLMFTKDDIIAQCKYYLANPFKRVEQINKGYNLLQQKHVTTF